MPRILLVVLVKAVFNCCSCKSGPTVRTLRVGSSQPQAIPDKCCLGAAREQVRAAGADVSTWAARALVDGGDGG